jgi:phosphatidylglycerophosphate synthase
MGTAETHYRARDLVLPPGLLSLVRIPLAAGFPFVADRPVAALAFLGAAGASDVLDGWLARRFSQVTPIGAALDPITDKLFVGVVVLTLLGIGLLSPLGVVLMGTREIGELPLALAFAFSARARRSMAGHSPAVLPGKIATILQFGTVAWALGRGPRLEIGIAATAVAGLVAAFAYWRRALGALRSEGRS